MSQKVLGSLNKESLHVSSNRTALYKTEGVETLVSCLDCGSLAFLDALRFWNQDCAKCVLCHSERLDLV